MRSRCVVLLLLCVCLRADVAATGAKCGRAEVSRSTLQALRVVGGMEAAPGSQPWLASLRSKALHFCGGAILTERWVLTAAHCFASTQKELVTVAVGEHDRRVLDEQEQIFNVKSVAVHDKYRRASPMSYDVALVELDGRVEFGTRVKPVCLPLPDEASAPGTGCLVAGWGRVRERGRLSVVLREVPLDLVHPARCRHVLRTVAGAEEGVLCAGPERGGRDACQGDSGSPLVCPTRTGAGQWEVVGVTSWGKGCGRSWSNNSRRPRSRRGSPGVFTDVRLLLPWIKQQLRQADDPWRAPASSCAVRHGLVPHSEGLIRNPEPPDGRYGNNQLCVWSISVAEGFSVLLEFDHFHLENDSLCRYDRLTVLTDTHKPVVMLCGRVSPGPVLLNNSHNATLLFSSDVSGAGSGFVVRHLAVQGQYEPRCGSVVLLKDQVTVESPNYPQPYRHDCELRWVVHAPAGHIVKLEFVDFDLEESSRCSYDSLTVLADVEGLEEIAVMCGHNVPPDVLSHHGLMVLLFSSDSSVSHRGFRALVSYISLSDLHDDTALEGQRDGLDQNTQGPGPPLVRLEETAPLVDESGIIRGVLLGQDRTATPDLVSDDEDYARESSGHEQDV